MYKIVLSDHLIQPQIDLLRTTALIGKLHSTISFMQFSFWAKQNWLGLKDIFLMDKQSLFFIAIFYSKEYRNCVHRYKGWFCKGIGIITLAWVPNFSMESVPPLFMPFWITLPGLSLEYRDPDIVEIVANQMGIFIKHDLIPYELAHLTVRVCLLLNLTKPLPKSIIMTSSIGKWNQDICI